MCVIVEERVEWSGVEYVLDDALVGIVRGGRCQRREEGREKGRKNSSNMRRKEQGREAE